VSRGMKALVALAPHTPATQAAAEVLAKALACPDVAAKRLCSSRTITNFYCLFLTEEVPEACQVGAHCSTLRLHEAVPGLAPPRALLAVAPCSSASSS
jgi:hypothetical protein